MEFFNKTDKYTVSFNVERETSGKVGNRSKVDKSNLTYIQIIPLIKKYEKPGTFTRPGVKVKGLTIRNENTGKVIYGWNLGKSATALTLMLPKDILTLNSAI